jgi:glycosyltransferase involved in cell wall biosynthesis
LAGGAGSDGARLHVVHPGVTMPPAPPAPLASRPGPATVITVARLSDRSKGHDVALEAMARLRERVPDVRWVVVGGGPLLEELRAAAESRGIADAVTFTGPIDDAELHRLLGAAHAFCLLSREPPPGQAGEGFGIAFVEAGAHGLPVVAGAIPGVLDAVSNEANGLLVDPRDPGAAAGALERVLTDLPLAQQLADRGRARAGRLEWPRVVARYREVVERVLSDRPAGRSCRRPTWIIDLVTGPRTVG